MRKRILLVSLGGTITMVRTTSSGLLPKLSADDLLRQSPEIAALADIETWSPAMLPSASLSLAQIIDLARELRERFARGCDGAVIVQGTDTLEETAFILDCLIPEAQPVVVTGAMRGGDVTGADGPTNIADALRVAVDDESRGRGTLVVFCGDVHAARLVRKTDTVSLSAFQSVGRAAVGAVVEGQVQFHSRTARSPALLSVDPARERPVALFRFAMGEDDRWLRCLPDLGYGGLVIEGAGGGHVAAAMMPAIRELATLMPVVLASRCSTGPVLRHTYAYPGSEIDLLSAGLLHAGDLCGLKARLLIALVLMCTSDRSRIEAEFRVRANAPVRREAMS